MRFALAILAAVALTACSTSGESPDASVPSQQPLGASCDPSLASPCAPAPTSCSTNVCANQVCTSIVLEDAGPACAPGGDASLPPTGAPCATSSDCDGGELCGFYPAAGCLATGVCLIPAATSSGLPSPACGCSGLPDPYVANGFTGAPASGTGPCVDGGPEGGATDGGADATAAPDATIDAGVDASVDAGADANDGAPE